MMNNRPRSVGAAIAARGTRELETKQRPLLLTYQQAGESEKLPRLEDTYWLIKNVSSCRE